MPTLITGPLYAAMVDALKSKSDVDQLDLLLQDTNYYDVPVLTGPLYGSLLRALRSDDAVKELDAAISAGVDPGYTFSGLLENRLAQALNSVTAAQAVQSIVAARLALDPLSTGLVAYYRLGSTADSGPNGYNLTNSGGVSFANDGLSGKCATFDSSATLTIDGASGPGLSIGASTSYTALALWRVPSVAASCGILCKGGNTTREYAMYYLTGSGWAAEVFDGASTTRRALGDYTFPGSTGNISADQWVLSSMWYDPSVTTHGTLYVQGCNLGAGQTSWNTADSQSLTGARGAPNTGPFEVGTRFNSMKHSGRIDSVAIYSGRILTQDERNTILTRTLAGQEWINV